MMNIRNIIAQILEVGLFVFSLKPKSSKASFFFLGGGGSCFCFWSLNSLSFVVVLDDRQSEPYQRYPERQSSASTCTAIRWLVDFLIVIIIIIISSRLPGFTTAATATITLQYRSE